MREAYNENSNNRHNCRLKSIDRLSIIEQDL